MRKTGFCICENKDADQLSCNREADQRLCFRYIDSTIPLLPKYEISSSSNLVWSYSLICVGPGRKPRRPVFSQRGSYTVIFLSLEMDTFRKKSFNFPVKISQFCHVISDV